MITYSALRQSLNLENCVKLRIDLKAWEGAIWSRPPTMRVPYSMLELPLFAQVFIPFQIRGGGSNADDILSPVSV